MPESASCRRLSLVPVCGVCKHPICPGCGDWCDNLIGETFELCCDGSCAPGRETTTIQVRADKQELIDGWKEKALQMVDTAAKAVHG